MNAPRMGVGNLVMEGVAVEFGHEGGQFIEDHPHHFEEGFLALRLMEVEVQVDDIGFPAGEAVVHRLAEKVLPDLY